MKRILILFFGVIAMMTSMAQAPIDVLKASNLSSNNYQTFYSNYGSAYRTQWMFVSFASSNSGDATLKINSLSAIHIRKWNGSSWVVLSGGELMTNKTYRVSYDLTNGYFMLGDDAIAVPGSDTQIIINNGGSFGTSGNLYYNPSTNIFNVSNGLTWVGSGTRSNNQYIGDALTDSTETGSSTRWTTMLGEGHTIRNRGSSIINDSYLANGYANALRVNGSQMYNSGVYGGQGNYFDVSGGGFVGSSQINGGLGNRVVVTGGTYKGIGIFEGSDHVLTNADRSGILFGVKSRISGKHSVAIGGYGLTDSGDSSTVVVPYLKLGYQPNALDTAVHILGWDYSTGKVVSRTAASFIPGAINGITFDGTNYGLGGDTDPAGAYIGLSGDIVFSTGTSGNGSFLISSIDSVNFSPINNVSITPNSGMVTLGKPSSGMVQVNGGIVTIQNNASGFGTKITGRSLGKVLSLTLPATNDDPIVDYYQFRAATTNATVTTLYTYATTTDNVHLLSAYVVARRTGGTAGTAGDAAAYKIEGVFNNIGGTVSQIGTTVQTVYGESQAAWDATFSISGTNVLVRVTGAANNNITWHVSELKSMKLNQ